MIRMALFALGFLAITVTLVIMQPGASRKAAEAPSVEPVVTRAAPQVDPLEPMSGLADVAAPKVAQPLPPVQRPQVARGGDMDDQSLRKMTWDTLSSLNHATGRETAPGQPGSLLHTIVRRSLDAPAAGQAAPQGVAPTIYVVQPGDSLVSIADKVYGDVNMTGPLFAANQAILTRPDDLAPGQTLVLPRK
ncbi:LysM peptidoglycan-binding domain-containing protein [Tropicibacter naphthalenivorans]|uniref:LysM domain/BON superfamily protein n=1 Tax=Tropicibacter naphthalenivorans TaxID=441103 RepID=A0A0P1GCB9_9RHOB|nr:LysM peptidoglycan-binding domain-containing protein [Tropicibacter naphthalenivorans]CUH79035.1 LysM domain/BON superfamily protein [Tropicibacter naphthalenivorans]SMD03840.1 LysM domain-containing protein [Tropicibacter naphthalenivorans]